MSLTIKVPPRKRSYIQEGETIKKEFFLHDFVFTKYGSYPHWPSRIISIDKKNLVNSDKFQVYFYGTHKSAVVTNKNMFSYVENKAKFGNMNSRKHFNAGMKEIEVEIERFTMFAKYFVSIKKFQSFSHYRQYDFVFSKTPGYPYWPSRIYSIDETKAQNEAKYFVFFYGTQNYVYLSEEEILPYNKINKTSFGNENDSKQYNEALIEIEEHISKTEHFLDLHQSKKISVEKESNSNETIQKLKLSEVVQYYDE